MLRLRNQVRIPCARFKVRGLRIFGTLQGFKA